MGEHPGTTELDLAEIIARVGSDVNGPEARARKVYVYLASAGRFTNWDLVCFSAEYIASMVGSLPWLDTVAKDLIRLVYLAHYIRFETISWLDKLTSVVPAESSKESDGPSTAGP